MNKIASRRQVANLTAARMGLGDRAELLVEAGQTRFEGSFSGWGTVYAFGLAIKVVDDVAMITGPAVALVEWIMLQVITPATVLQHQVIAR